MTKNMLYAMGHMLDLDDKEGTIETLRRIPAEAWVDKLTRICRMNGESRFSVADHCAMAAAIIYPGPCVGFFRLLLHDMHEAVVGDILAPVRPVPEPGLWIRDAFIQYTPEEIGLIKEADHYALDLELATLTDVDLRDRLRQSCAQGAKFACKEAFTLLLRGEL